MRAEEARAARDDRGRHGASVVGGLTALTKCLLEREVECRASYLRAGVEGHRASSENVRPMRFPLAALAAALVIAAVVLPASPAAAAPRCAQDRATPAYSGSVLRALRSKRDVWGEQLLRRPGGPTYAAVRRLLKPLLFARARAEAADRVRRLLPPLRAAAREPRRPGHRPPRRRRQPDPRAHGGGREPARPRRAGRPRAASARASRGSLQPTLAEGYLPILETRYMDSAGVRYRQESFAVRGLGTGALISFVSVTASAARSGAVVRLVHSTKRGVRSAQGGHEDSALHYRVAARPDRDPLRRLASRRPAPSRRSTRTRTRSRATGWPSSGTRASARPSSTTCPSRS